MLVDRPGSAQSEIRVGHVGIRRKTPDFYTVAVLNAILGGVFDSRLNRIIREEKGYAYSIWSAFDMRRSAGPFVIRTAVETDVTAPALNDIWQIVIGMREAQVEPRELESARDYLVGVFPLRFEVPAQVAAALAGLVSTSCRTTSSIATGRPSPPFRQRTCSTPPADSSGRPTCRSSLWVTRPRSKAHCVS